MKLTDIIAAVFIASVVGYGAMTASAHINADDLAIKRISIEMAQVQGDNWQSGSHEHRFVTKR